VGKFLDSYRQLKRINKQVRGRKKYLAQFPWYTADTEHEIIVSNSLDLNSDTTYKTEILEIGTGHSVGLMFELASKKIITEIKCPICGKAAKLNTHWQAFQCDDAIWEIMD